MEQDDGSQLVVGEVSRGQSVGEMALLTKERRSATVYAVRDSELLKLSLPAFNRLIEKQPQAMMAIVRVIIDRLRKQMSGSPAVTSLPVMIGVIPASSNVPLFQFAKLYHPPGQAVVSGRQTRRSLSVRPVQTPPPARSRWNWRVFVRVKGLCASNWYYYTKVEHSNR